MADLDLLTEKYNLVSSPEYKRIRELQLNSIVEMANKQIDPLIIKGMLKNINDTDNWENDFKLAKKKNEEQKK